MRKSGQEVAPSLGNGFSYWELAAPWDLIAGNGHAAKP